MINATQKKLREALFFLRQLFNESEKVVRNEPEAFQFYLSAFLSATRSVTFALQYEEKDKYDAWFPRWLRNRNEEDHKLFEFLKTQRNVEQKQGGTKVNVFWEYIPVIEVRTDNRGHLSYGFHWFEPPGTPPPRVGLSVHYFELAGDEREVTAACKRYVDILDVLVRDFIEAHS